MFGQSTDDTVHFFLKNLLDKDMHVFDLPPYIFLSERNLTQQHCQGNIFYIFFGLKTKIIGLENFVYSTKGK